MSDNESATSERTHSPSFTREEIVLTLDTYYQIDPENISSGHPKVLELSKLLKQLSIHSLEERPDRKEFRSAEGIRGRLSEIRRTIEGTNSRKHKGYLEALRTYSDDRRRLSEDAQRIREKYQDRSLENGELGVRDLSENTRPTFEMGKVYHRRDDLHAEYGGQQQGGISTPAKHPVVFLFTGDAGSDFGYQDEFRANGMFWYTGEGQQGDMQMTRGNRAIRDHEEDGKTLHLFESIGSGEIRYFGEGTYLTHHIEERPDADDNLRQVFVFELAVDVGADTAASVDEETQSLKDLRRKSLSELRRAALQSASRSATTKQRRQSIYYRSKAIKEYVLRRAEGHCEGCETKAPFKTPKGQPYLEPHHVERVSDGGPDHPRWVIALCPTCHRRVHHGYNGDDYNQQLIEKLGEIERLQGELF